MCYGKDFTALIDAGRGDLVYGLEKPKRQKYLSLLRIEEMLTVTMNTYNDFLLALLRKYYQVDDRDFIEYKEQEFDEIEKIIVKADISIRNAFEQHLRFHAESFLNDEAYRIDKALEDIRNGHRLKSRANEGEPDDMLAFKRGCKLGLKDLIIKGFKVDGRSPVLHFALDGIDIEAVMNKAEKYGYGITSSELRFLYRHRDRIANKVIFYSEGKSVKCPWEREGNRWEESYIPSGI